MYVHAARARVLASVSPTVQLPWWLDRRRAGPRAVHAGPGPDRLEPGRLPALQIRLQQPHDADRHGRAAAHRRGGRCDLGLWRYPHQRRLPHGDWPRAPAHRPRAEEVRKVAITIAERISATPMQQAFGTVSAARVSDLRFAIGGEVETVNPIMRNGALVRKGQTLATLDTELLKLSVNSLIFILEV